MVEVRSTDICEIGVDMFRRDLKTQSLNNKGPKGSGDKDKKMVING